MNTPLEKIGFLPNQRGGCWYRQERDLYTIQIIPDRKGWRLGIAQAGGMRWGKRVFTSQVEAARHAFDFLHDDKMRFNLQRAVAEQKLSEQLRNASLN